MSTLELLRMTIKVLERKGNSFALYEARHALFTIRLKYSIEARTAFFVRLNPCSSVSSVVKERQPCNL